MAVVKAAEEPPEMEDGEAKVETEPEATAATLKVTLDDKIAYVPLDTMVWTILPDASFSSWYFRLCHALMRDFVSGWRALSRRPWKLLRLCMLWQRKQKLQRQRRTALRTRVLGCVDFFEH